jgi:hypothetical protein
MCSKSRQEAIRNSTMHIKKQVAQEAQQKSNASSPNSSKSSPLVPLVSVCMTRSTPALPPFIAQLPIKFAFLPLIVSAKSLNACIMFLSSSFLQPCAGRDLQNPHLI